MRRIFGLIALLLAAYGARAQEPPHGESATQPSPGHFTVKEGFSFYSFRLDEGPRDGRKRAQEYEWLTTFNFGLARDLSLSFRAPIIYRHERYARSGHINDDGGIGDLTILGKYRFFQKDTGPLDTIRAAVLVGLDFRLGDQPFTSDSYDPILGLAYTQIAGRHGFNASTTWTFTLDGLDGYPLRAGMLNADVWRTDLAYLYRLVPAEFTIDSAGGLYLVGELNTVYETNADVEMFVSPGIMWEAAHWVLEASVQLPVWSDVDFRGETEYVFFVGVRFSL